jgi:predicted Zn-dependent protease with MMP-like domain
VITFEETGVMLDEIADGIPEDFYRELNGGVILLPDIKMHSENQGNDLNGNANLFILGEYHNDRTGYGGLGRYIAIYYGSFIKLYANLSAADQKEKLRGILIHEFTHHMESLAGEKGLEIKDAQKMDEYRKKFIK